MQIGFVADGVPFADTEASLNTSSAVVAGTASPAAQTLENSKAMTKTESTSTATLGVNDGYIKDDLIERLRDKRHCNDWYLRNEAADALAQCRAEKEHWVEVASQAILNEASAQQREKGYLSELADYAKEVPALRVEVEQLKTTDWPWEVEKLRKRVAELEHQFSEKNNR